MYVESDWRPPKVNLAFFWLSPRSHSHDRWQNGCFASTMTQARCGVFRSGVASAFSLRLWALTGESCIFWDYITSSGGGGGGQKNKGMSQAPKLAFLRENLPYASIGIKGTSRRGGASKASISAKERPLVSGTKKKTKMKPDNRNLKVREEGWKQHRTRGP